MSHTDHQRRAALTKASFLVAAGLQLGCGAVFISDVVVEWRNMSTHTWVEALAVLALVIGGFVSLREYHRVVQRNQRVENELSAASGAFQEVIEQHFETWGLSAAERDVALLSIKGVPISEIAQMRSTKEGTIKAQSAAIYRKVGVSSRAELISVVIEDMVSGLSVAAQKQ
jgi:DNA-binding NarL/FixJ family response regulator